MNKIKKSINWREESQDERLRRIGADAYNVTQLGKTEPPHTGRYNKFFERGIYVDVVSGEPLFSSADKFDSGCGWPSFGDTIVEDNVKYREDSSYGMLRTEVRSKLSDAHLGHVFDDGPLEYEGRRYCINSAAIRFIPYEKMEEAGYGEYKKYLKGV